MLQGMASGVDQRHFQELSTLDPAEVCRRALCTWDEQNHSYRLKVWGEEYAVYPHASRIECLGTNRGFHAYLSLFMVHYLLRAQAVPPTGEWISEKDLPGGVTFFRGPHSIPAWLITHRCGNDLRSFRKRSAKLEGSPLNMGDAAFCFQLAPRIPVSVLYFAGDEDFPPESKLLYDRTISDHLTLDIVFALAVAVCTRIAGDW